MGKFLFGKWSRGFLFTFGRIKETEKQQGTSNSPITAGKYLKRSNLIGVSQLN